MAKKVIENKEVEVKAKIEIEAFEGEIEFECTGKSKHLKAGLKVNLPYVLAKLFHKQGYIK